MVIHRTLFKRVPPQRGELHWISPPGQQLSSGHSTNRFNTSPVHFMTIFVGNLSFDAEVEDLQNLFTQYGEVRKCVLPLDRDTGRKRGFAFVDLANASDETKAIDDLQNGGGGGGGGGRSRW
jgi:RNA recognition motif-containing protein